MPVPAIAVMASGTGSTFRAILKAIEKGSLNAEVAVLVVDRADTGAERIAREHGVPVVTLDRRAGRRELSRRASEAIDVRVELVVLAGYLSIVTEPLLSRFRARMINLHPSLLPRHGGAGMYGVRVHEAVLAAGEPDSGCTVHLVDAGTDTGEVVLQRRIPVLAGDTAATLAARLRPVEHEAIVEAIGRLLDEGRKR